MKAHGKQIDAIASKKDPNEKRGDGIRKARKKLGDSKLKIRGEILEAAKRKREDNSKTHEQKCKLLYEDIMIVPYYVFGDHTRCKEFGGWPCSEENCEEEENEMSSLIKAGVS